MFYYIQNFEYLIFDMIFDSSKSVNFVDIKSKQTIADLSYAIYTC